MHNEKALIHEFIIFFAHKILEGCVGESGEKIVQK